MAKKKPEPSVNIVPPRKPCRCEQITEEQIIAGVILALVAGMLLCFICGIWSENVWWVKPGATFGTLTAASLLYGFLKYG